MVPATTHLIGFSRETIWPLGQIALLVKIGDEVHSTSAWMNFMVIRSPSQHNAIIGRPGIRRLRAVPSTTHGMLKFPVEGGTVTLQSSRVIPMECAMISEPSIQNPAVNQVLEEKINIAIHPEYPDQTVAIGSTLTEKGRKGLCSLLKQNLDIFAWKPADMTGVPRNIAEHRLNIREGYSYTDPVRQKKRGQPSKNSMTNLECGVDFKDLNNACPKDCYPLPEIDWKVESLCGYSFKCFLDAYKGYHQIKMAKEDEEKTAFITSQGIFCYSKMPFGLKNAGSTYQRLVDKAFKSRLGRQLRVSVKFSKKKLLPFFKHEKTSTKERFQWTPKAEEAFKQMKKLIAELPTLTAPRENEELIIYLAAAKEAISAVLMTDREGWQILVYFILPSTHGRCNNKSTDKATVVKFENIWKDAEVEVRGEGVEGLEGEGGGWKRPEEIVFGTKLMAEPVGTTERWTLFHRTARPQDGSEVV
ncbi:reverse transcriptase domain-containing protein [Tanacetum coccineum]